VELFARTTDGILSLAEFRELLDSGRKLKIKFGTDVTAPFLHLGHAVNLWMMREMQERGHLVQFLIGDFTTLVGDPTGRSGARTSPSRKFSR
jgi:tyrosyl-tRNA synthetase